MADDRNHVVSRRDPIKTTVEVDGRSLVFEARPIPRWRARNDFGNIIVEKYTTAMNSWLHGYTEGDEYLLKGEMFEHAMPYDELFLWAYGTYDEYTQEHRQPTPPSADLIAQFELLDFNGMIAVLETALEVNDLTEQAYMLDPRKKDQSLLMVPASSNADDGQKMESSAASG